MTHYNQRRVTSPRKRTNPEKGIGIDPKWVDITWEEAIETISTNLRQVYETDPSKLYLQTWNSGGDKGDLGRWIGALRPVFGTANVQGGLSSSCGKTIHPIQYLVAGGFHEEPDFHYCKYLICVGTQMGIASREGFNHQVPDCATARERGMKLVVVDPVGNNAAAKAHEWLPIRPGTDAAFGLGMLHVLLNEIKIYDAEFLKNRTNAAYLVGSTGEYIRDSASKKPLLHDLTDGINKTYDDPTLKEPALEGVYDVQGQEAKPAFELLKARAAKYPPERVEEITSIPATILRRIAREFGEAAQIGATIKIDNVELPYRPVAISWDRGPQGHKHAWNHSWALQLPVLVLGAINVVGSNSAVAGASNYPIKAWPEAGKDGMMERSGAPAFGHGAHAAHPGRQVTKPIRADLYELFPVAGHTKTVVPMTFSEPEKFGLDPHGVSMVIHSPANEIQGGFGEVNQVAAWYKSMDFVVGFAIELNETHAFDDIVLPARTYLEQGSFGDTLTHPEPAVSGEHVGFRQIQQTVLEAPEGVEDAEEVLMEIYSRAGFLDQVYQGINLSLGLREPYRLEPGQRYTPHEINDRHAKSHFDEEHGWDWFKENGVLVWTRDVAERYPGPFIQARVPVYLEHFVERGGELDAVLAEMGLEDWNTEDYEGIPEWRPCEAMEKLNKGEIDAIGVHYKLPYVYGAFGQANPWIHELCEKLSHSYGVLVNTRLAQRKGIKDGDEIWLETPVRKVKAQARVTQMVHPEVIGIAAHSGHWAEGKRVSEGKGINFNSLLVHDMEHIDMISAALDHCAQLKVYKA